MDFASGKRQLLTYFKKYQSVLLILVLGISLMLLPQKQQQSIPEAPVQESQPDLEEELEEILSQISGVGRAEVLLTEECGSSTVYQTDENQNRSDLDTVIITDKNREETGLVRQILPPIYRGALIVCQGADSAGVRLSVVEAVKRVTGLSSDCIIVLKRK